MENMEEKPNDDDKFFDFGDLIDEVSENQYSENVTAYLVVKLLKTGESQFSIFQKDAKANPILIQSVVGLLEMTKAQVLDDYLNQLYSEDFNDTEE